MTTLSRRQYILPVDSDHPEAIFFLCKDGTTKIASMQEAFEPCEGCDCGWAAVQALAYIEPREPAPIVQRVMRDLIDYASTHGGHMPKEWYLDRSDTIELAQAILNTSRYAHPPRINSAGNFTLMGVPILMKGPK